MRAALAFFLLSLFSCAAPCPAQEKKSQPARVTSRVVTKVLVQPKARLTKRIILLVDSSGSMFGHLPDVVDAVLMIAQQPIDEMEIAVVAFRCRGSFDLTSRSWVRWPGIKEKGVPWGWARLPSPKAVLKATAWLQSFGAGGGTAPEDGLEHALKERRDHLSLVVISDGIFHAAPVTEALGRAQEARKKAGLAPAVVACLGISAGVTGQATLEAVAKAGGGGFYVRKRVYTKVPRLPKTRARATR